MKGTDAERMSEGISLTKSVAVQPRSGDVPRTMGSLGSFVMMFTGITRVFDAEDSEDSSRSIDHRAKPTGLLTNPQFPTSQTQHLPSCVRQKPIHQRRNDWPLRPQQLQHRHQPCQRGEPIWLTLCSAASIQMSPHSTSTASPRISMSDMGQSECTRCTSVRACNPRSSAADRSPSCRRPWMGSRTHSLERRQIDGRIREADAGTLRVRAGGPMAAGFVFSQRWSVCEGTADDVS